MKKVYIMMAFLFCVSSSSFALIVRLATDQDIINLKRDILQGKIKVGVTHLKEIRRQYGDAKTITDTERDITYDYGDLKIEFNKERIWRKWEYDSFKKPAYTKAIDNLRFDLESKKLIGENITAVKIFKDYGLPTESMGSSEDGEWAIYYYGDIKLMFKNNYVINNFKGKNLEVASELQTLLKPKSTEAEKSSPQVK